ncbi:hypothetical protein HDU96_003938 [Phlyctochytrium bullatum]|nr:hypothetical protein HDU96_003938 [Phlyctochytrium bullatum]
MDSVTTTSTTSHPPTNDALHVVAPLPTAVPAIRAIDRHVTTTTTPAAAPLDNLELSLDGLLALTTLHRTFLDTLRTSLPLRNDTSRHVSALMSLLQDTTTNPWPTAEHLPGPVLAAAIEMLDLPQGSWDVFLADWATTLALTMGFMVGPVDDDVETMLEGARGVVAVVRRRYWMRLLEGVSEAEVVRADEMVRARVGLGKGEGEKGEVAEKIRARLMMMEVAVVRAVMWKFAKVDGDESETEVGEVVTEEAKEAPGVAVGGWVLPEAAVGSRKMMWRRKKVKGKGEPAGVNVATGGNANATDGADNAVPVVAAAADI